MPFDPARDEKPHPAGAVFTVFAVLRAHLGSEKGIRKNKQPQEP
jgi:hypothetical protein